MGPAAPPEAETLLLPSRAAALDACRAALAAADGPVLVTGSTGTGKTWLLGRLAASPADRLEWLTIDLPPEAGPADLHASIAHALGFLDPPGDQSHFRGRLADFLGERAEDGRRLALAIDEAHNAGTTALEEVRLISNRLGQPQGFEALVLLGQTPLGRRLAAPGAEGLAARLAPRVHLGPIDADEAAMLLNHHRPGRPWAVAEVERLHRQSAGNPRRLLRLADTAIPAQTLLEPGFASPGSPPEPAPPRATIPLIGEARPPLRVEEGLIEVGWDPGSEPRIESRPAAEDHMPGPADETVERIDDHYAALQAWDEWARNQGRQPAIASRTATTRELRVEGTTAVEPAEPPASPVPGHPNVWAEGEQTFAPYSQLFSRLKQARDAE